MFGLGPTELIIIAVIILLLFGAKRLPEIGKGLGGAIREFRDIKKEVGSDKAEKGDSGNEAGVEKKEEPKSVEAQVGEKLMDQVPGVKGVMNAKKKAEKLKNLFD